MEDVADGGTIEILYKAEPYIFPKTVIDKDVRIIGVVGDNGKLPTINFSGIGSPAIQVESPNFFHMENITLCFQSYETLIESRTRNICLNNITTNYSYPIVISEPINSNEIDATIANCTFNSFAPKIEFTTLVTGSISFSNNSFSTTSLIINNTGADISIFSNRFLNSGIVNESNTTGIITVEDNSFEGMRCIINSSSSAGIIINRNRFISDNRYIYNNDSTSDLNLCGNWWDNINGPMGSDSLIELSGNIDYSNWALDEQCTVFLNKEVPPDEVFVDKEYTVKNSGDYVWDYQAFNNITDAISRVSDGGTVHISFGEYNESLILDKCVYLAGSIDNPPIITTTDDSIINITADNVELNNLKLDGKNSVLTAVNGENINSLTINSIEISNVVSSSISLNNISGYINRFLQYL